MGPVDMCKGERAVADETPVAPQSKFLLVGSERSGSTMFRLILDHHPRLSCMYESDFMVAPYGRYAHRSVVDYARALADDWHFAHSGLSFPDGANSYAEVIDAFFRQRVMSSGKRIVGATVQDAFHHLPELFPDVRYVHLIRDGRPVAASIVNMGWSGNVYHAAKRWRRTIEDVRALQRRIPGERWLEVQYETFLARPTETLKRVCDFLGVAYDQQMLGYDADSTYDAPDPANADRWQKKMEPREIQQAEMGAGDVLEQAGYRRMFPPVEPGWLERSFLLLHHRVSRVSFNIRRFGAYLVIARKLWRILGVRRPRLERRYAAIRDAHVR